MADFPIHLVHIMPQIGIGEVEKQFLVLITLTMNLKKLSMESRSLKRSQVDDKKKRQGNWRKIMKDCTANAWVRFLRASGVHIVEAEGILWYQANKGLFPCYVPHQVPRISAKQAQVALKKTKGVWFARWPSCCGDIRVSKWWSVIREGYWDLATVKDKKDRWAVRQGRKRLFARRLDAEEVMSYAPEVVNKARSRESRTKAKRCTPESFEPRIAASKEIPGVLEYYGVFEGKKMVGWAENHIVDNACLMVATKHDPNYLRKYSSYCLLDTMLNDYLNERKLSYLYDGERSIYHPTGFQDFLIRVFGFVKKYSLLNIVYRKPLQTAIYLAYPFRDCINYLARRLPVSQLWIMKTILQQESIVRACRQLG